ncbi:unnamed protein product, partial [Prorocentrum cordatum]
PASAGGSRVRQSVGELRHPPVRRGRDQKERKNGPRRREGGKQGGREERGLEARIPAADGPERGTQTPLPIRACSPSARSRTGGGPERDVRRGGPSLKARKSPSLPRCCL